MKNKNLARIAYNKKEDMYCLMLSTDDGESWDFSFGTKCQRRAGEAPDAEPMYISCELIENMKHAIRCGFEMVF